MPASLYVLLGFALAPCLLGGGGGEPAHPQRHGEPPVRRAAAPVAGIAFADVTAAAGIQDLGISFGVSIGDADGDGRPDVFTSGHYMAHPRLWRNQGNGTFVDVTAWLQPPPTGDMHGAQWADFDNDGQQELVLMTGASYGMSSEPKRIYKRTAAGFVDVAPQWGLNIGTMRGRSPLAVDYDRDGALDLFLTAALRADGLTPPTLYRFDRGVFREVGSYQGFGGQTGTTFGVHGDLDGDGVLDAFFEGFPNRAYSFGPNVVQDITSQLGLPPLPMFPMLQDALVADLTGDGRNDLYFARATNRSSAHRDGPLTIEFCALLQGDQHEVRFSSLPGHFLWFDWGDVGLWTTNRVYIGAQGHHPATTYGVALDPNDPNCHGIAGHIAGQSAGIYIGYDVTTAEWVVACSSPIQDEIYVRAISSQPVSEPTTVGFSATAPAPADVLLVRENGRYADQSLRRGIPSWLQGRSVVAADFDNDMDLDLYVVRSLRSCNLPNVLLENRGGGRFQPLAGVAPGSVHGIGDAVATCDYDGDGRVDLFLVNGTGRSYRTNGAPGAFADEGPAQLLRNVSANGNHWLGVKLVGTASNRDGIGARVEVRCGNRIQVREHGGGMHRSSQNHGIHFGLGGHAVADHVEVIWPSGMRTMVRGVACDQTVTIVE